MGWGWGEGEGGKKGARLSRRMGGGGGWDGVGVGGLP